MAQKRLKRPRDPLQLAKLIGDIATGQIEADAKRENGGGFAALARLGGLRGGPARKAALSPNARSAIARKAAKARWGRRDEKPKT